jgi:hypothetical protein
MPSSERLKFAHHFVKDGSVDAICPRCCATVASAASETDLMLKEQRHVCDPFVVSYYEFFKKMPRSETISEQFNRDQNIVGKPKPS